MMLNQLSIEQICRKLKPLFGKKTEDVCLQDAMAEARKVKEVTYQGKTYPVDYQKKVLGELTDREIEEYSGLVNKRYADNNKGSSNDLFFRDEKAIRYSKNDDRVIDQANMCLTNFFIGNDLINNELGAPKMHAVYWGSETDRPFLVMNEFDLVRLSYATQIIKQKLKNEFKGKMEKIRLMGYCGLERDTTDNWNFGFDFVSEESVFFDFDHWRTSNGIIIPKLNEQGVIV